jgi:hypothetical protein
MTMHLIAALQERGFAGRALRGSVLLDMRTPNR